MKTVKLALGLTPDIQEGLAKGIYTRDGGVIRNAENGRFVAFLRESEIPKESKGEISPNFNEKYQISSVITGFQLKDISNKLESIEHRVIKIHEDIRGTKERVETLNMKADAEFFANVIGPIRNAQIALEENKTEKLHGYRDQLVQAEVIFQYLLNNYKNSDAASRFRFYPEELAAYSTSQILCLMAIRDMSLLLNEASTAEKYSSLLTEKARETQNTMEKITLHPSSLFWLKDVHRFVLLQHRENVEKLEAQHEQLSVLKEEDDGFKRFAAYVYDN